MDKRQADCWQVWCRREIEAHGRRMALLMSSGVPAERWPVAMLNGWGSGRRAMRSLLAGVTVQVVEDVALCGHQGSVSEPGGLTIRLTGEMLEALALGEISLWRPAGLLPPT